MRRVAVDAEHPRRGMEHGGHVAAGNGLVVLNRVDLRGHAWPVPRVAVVVRPFHGHAEQRMHVEFHDAAGPRVDVDVRVVGVGDGEERIVDVFARIVECLRHPDEVAGHHGRGACGPVAVGGHEQRVALRDAHGGLKGRHADAVVGALCGIRQVASAQVNGVVAPHVNGVGEVVPGEFWTLKRPDAGDHRFLFHFGLAKTAGKGDGNHEGCKQKRPSGMHGGPMAS